MFILALLAMGQLGPMDRSSEDKVSEVKSLLGAFGVEGPLRLKSVNVPDESKEWPALVVLSARDRAQYSAYFMPGTSKPYAVFRGNESDDIPKLPRHPVVDPVLDRRVNQWVAQVCGSHEIHFDGIQADSHNVGSAEFSIRKNGYPFILGYNSYFYCFSLTVPEGHFLSMSMNEKLPPVDSRCATVSDGQAVAILKRVFATELAPKALAEHGWKISYKLTPGRILGYDLLPNEFVAHLVWLVPYCVSGELGSFTKYSPYRTLLIDAVTGQPINVR